MGRNLILVVDTDHRVLRFTSIGLRSAGYDVLTSTDGENGVNIAESQRPDIILLDVSMMRPNAADIMRALRAVTAAPIIALSIDDSTRGEMQELGAADFVGKPFYMDDLLKRISDLLHQSKDKGTDGAGPKAS